MAGRIKRKVTVHPEDGRSMTALEIMHACAQMPPDVKPKMLIRLNGEVKQMEAEIEVVPDGLG